VEDFRGGCWGVAWPIRLLLSAILAGMVATRANFVGLVALRRRTASKRGMFSISLCTILGGKRCPTAEPGWAASNMPRVMVKTFNYYFGYDLDCYCYYSDYCSGRQRCNGYRYRRYASSRYRS